LNCFPTMKQCFSLTIFQHKHKHKLNFSINEQGGLKLYCAATWLKKCDSAAHWSLLPQKRKTNKGERGNLRKYMCLVVHYLQNDWIVLLWFSVVFSPAAVQPCSLLAVVLPFYRKVCTERKPLFLQCSSIKLPWAPLAKHL
jgi:hypothetical protein